MSANTDKKREPAHAGTTSKGKKASGTVEEPDVKPDPDLYDPMGMAGRKAGIVKEVEQDLQEKAGHRPGKEGKGTK